MLFTGPSGIGKTTVALAIANELDLEVLLINASLNGNIETIRTEIQQFGSTIAFNGKRKLIILDEGDGLTAAAQASLRGVMNDLADNCSFIITANYRNKVIEPIISRLSEVNFLFDKKELPTLAVGLYNFLITRLTEAGTQFDKAAVQQFLKQRLTVTSDIRKIILDAQKISRTGVFSADSLLLSDSSRLEELMHHLKSKNFNNMRTWVGENSDIEPANVFRYLYNNVSQVASGAQIPMIVSIINEYQYKHAFVIDKEINMVTMIATISSSL